MRWFCLSTDRPGARVEFSTGDYGAPTESRDFICAFRQAAVAKVLPLDACHNAFLANAEEDVSLPITALSRDG